MVRSVVDDPLFFNAPDGKSDPQAELNATIRAFFDEKSYGLEGREQHPQCMFVARYRWLDEQLDFDTARLRKVPCERFDEWFKALDPAGLTLILASTYLNNPSSAFGHTLLRIDQHGQNEKSRLLAYASNYAAATREDNAIVYAVRGIFGGYAGIFSVEPYYEKVKTYSDLENRDMWEYLLDLNEREVEDIVYHLWEMRGVNIDYYYFDENCAYMLLRLIEVGRPTLNLTENLYSWVIPVDTVRVVEHSGIVSRHVYRPSSATLLLQDIKARGSDTVHRARLLALGEIEIEPNESSATLDLAYDYLQYLQLGGDIEGEEYEKRSYALLGARSRISPLSVQNPPDPSVKQPDHRPDEGHGTLRLRTEFGGDDGLLYSEVEFRPAYHDSLDPSEGYQDGAEIRFFSLRLREWESRGVELEEFSPLQIQSLTPQNELLNPTSFQLLTGVSRTKFADGDDSLVSKLSVGGGLTREWFDVLNVSLLGKGRLELSGAYDENLALGAGTAFLAFLKQSESAKAGLIIDVARFGYGDEHNKFSMRFEQRLTISEKTALRFYLSHGQEVRTKVDAAGVMFDYFL